MPTFFGDAMAKIHIIWDPNDKLVHNTEMSKQLGLKIAMMPLDEDATDTYIVRTTQELLIMFMRQFTHD